jgi:pimeloyl-ACP methyl ester carboxylesterase
MIYQHINSTKIKLLVSVAFGGLSLHEMYPILAESKVTPSAYKKLYRQLIGDYYKTKPYPNSDTDGYIEMPFKFCSIVDIRPFDYYAKINIPVLFVHGAKDSRIPVEST